MSQYQSYIEQNLTNRLVKAQQEMVSLKARQNYGTSQIKTYESNSLNFASIQYASEGTYFYGRGTDILHLAFKGNKPNKTVIARLRMNFLNIGNTYVTCNYFKEIRSSTPNQIEWYIWVGGVGDSSPNWSISLNALTNDEGIFYTVEQFSLLDNLWVTGS